MKIGEFVLLFSEDESYLIRVSDNDLHTKSGIVSSQKLFQSKIGGRVHTHIGKEFVVLRPNIKDFLDKLAKRGPQIIMPKDTSLILSYTGVGPGSLIIDAGTGSAYLAIFLANYVTPSKV